MVKKFSLKSFTAGVVAGSLLFSGVAYASSSIKLLVDGKEVASDVEPQMIDGRVMVSARFLAEALGAKVEWDEHTNAVIVTSKAKLGQAALDIPAAVSLVKNGLSAYWHVANGGKQVDGAEVKSFSVDGLDYRYLGEDIDTRAELTAYLGQFFTAEAVAAILKDMKIIEHEGKMAQPNADGGSLLGYGNLQAELIKASDATAQFEFQFELGQDGEHEPIRISFENEGAAGWKISSTPKEIYQQGSKQGE